MKRTVCVLSLAAMLLACAGCSGTNPGTTMMLGPGDNAYQQLAFTTAKDVMAQYFEIDPAGTDPQTGTIKSRPRSVPEFQERAFSSSPTRQLATLQIFTSEGQTMAQVTVAVQQLGTSVFRASKNEGSYSGVPNETPAQVDAATTPEQNQTWKTIDYSYRTQQNILDDLYRRLHPETGPQPPSGGKSPGTNPSPPG
jgi:hypothetical protein